MDSIQQLADLALRTLDAQQAYFRTRTFADLGASKRLEQELREMATLVLVNATQATLFDGESNE